MTLLSFRVRWNRLPPLVRKLVSLTVILVFAYLFAPLFWDPLDQRFYDSFQSRWRVDPWKDVVVVGIDRSTRTEFLKPPVYPLSRHTQEHAQLIRSLDRAGARGIVIDLSLSEDAFAEPPKAMIDAMRASGRVRLICYLEEQQNVGRLGGRSTLVQIRLPARELLRASAGAYVADVQLDRDGTLRRMYPDPRLGRLGLQSVPEHLSGRTLRDPSPIVFPTVDRPIPQVSYRDVVEGKPEALSVVSDRFVFVGQVDDVLSDFVAVPIPQKLSSGSVVRGLPGVAVLAAMTETLIEGRPVQDSPPWTVFLWNFGWCFLSILIIPRRRPWLATLVLVAVATAAILITGLMHSLLGFVIPCGLLFGCLFLTSAHSIVSTHVETTQILHREQVENERVRRELDTARNTQLALLPREIPQVPGLNVWGVNVSSLEVSGDYFDVFDSEASGELILVIADVCGKGLPAAIIMSNVHAALHSHMGRDHLDLAMIAEDLNRLLFEHTAPDKFVTFFMAAVDKSSHRVRYVSAGHDPPIHLAGTGGTSTFDLGGVPLGLLSDSTYPEGEKGLAPGDLLCLYTDGVTEAMTPEGDMFERERLEETFRSSRAQDAKEITEAILTRVFAFTGLEHQADDVTMVVLKVLEG